MGDPLFHAESSARRFGGEPSDYLHIHTLMDSSKLFLADWRHRALMHNTFGIHILETLIGASFNRKSDNKAVCTRTVVSQHIMEDLGAIPTPGEFLREMPLRSWMNGISASVKNRMQNMSIEGGDDTTREAYINSVVQWRSVGVECPTKDATYFVCFQDGVVTSAKWENKNFVHTINNPVAYWAELPIGPIIPPPNHEQHEVTT